MEVIEFADIRDVPILKAGVHHSHNAGEIEVTDQFLDELVENTNEANDFIRHSIELGRYPGEKNAALNEALKKPVPGRLNIHHQDIFPETIKDKVKDVWVEYKKVDRDGKPWIVENFNDVPGDIAKTLKQQFPYRSIEILTADYGKGPKKIIRSTAFLNKFTPPAVKGQSPDLTVEFAGGESPVIVLMCDDIDTSFPTNNQEAIMPEETQEKKGKQPEVKEVDVSELTGKLSEKEVQIAELQAQLDATKEKEQSTESTVAELQAEQEKAQAHIMELQAQQDQAEVREFCLTMENTPIVDKAGQKFIPSPAFNEIVQLNVASSSKAAVIEFADGDKTARQTIQDIFSQVLELARTGSILVPITEMAGSFAEPNAPKQTDLEKAQALQKAEDITYAAALLRVKEDK